MENTSSQKITEFRILFSDKLIDAPGSQVINEDGGQKYFRRITITDGKLTYGDFFIFTISLLCHEKFHAEESKLLIDIECELDEEAIKKLIDCAKEYNSSSFTVSIRYPKRDSAREVSMTELHNLLTKG